MFDETIIHDFSYPFCSIALFVKVKNSTIIKERFLPFLNFSYLPLQISSFFRFIMMAKGIWSWFDQIKLIYSSRDHSKYLQTFEIKTKDKQTYYYYLLYTSVSCKNHGWWIQVCLCLARTVTSVSEETKLEETFFAVSNASVNFHWSFGVKALFPMYPAFC